MQGSKYSPKESVISRKPTAKTTKTATIANPTVVKKAATKRKHVTFQVQAKPDSKVYIAGDFNGWNHQEKELSDPNGNGLYQCAIALKPGTYEYKFHINDNWCVDPENPNFSQNPMGTLNSVIIVE
jgi:1,4-alpha-glucan branching enzyme